MKAKRRMSWKAWAGFMDDRIDLDLFVNAASGKIYGSVYQTRRLALESYEDVRPVRITEIRKRK